MQFYQYFEELIEKKSQVDFKEKEEGFQPMPMYAVTLDNFLDRFGDKKAALENLAGVLQIG